MPAKPTKRGNQGKPRGINLTIRVSRKLRELSELISELERAEERIYEGNQQKDHQRDEFTCQADALLLNIGQVKKRIQERHNTRLSQGNNANVIREAKNIDDTIKNDLEVQFMQLKDAYKHQARLRKFYKPEELEKKFQTLQVAKHQMEQCKALMASDSYAPEVVQDLCNFNDQMKSANVDPPAGMDEWREPTEEESAIISRWKARDADFDHQLGEIGLVVDKLGEIAKDMGEKAQRQEDLTHVLYCEADATNEALKDLNSRVKTLVAKKGGGSNLCMRISLLVVMFALIGWLSTIVKNRL